MHEDRYALPQRRARARPLRRARRRADSRPRCAAFPVGSSTAAARHPARRLARGAQRRLRGRRRHQFPHDPVRPREPGQVPPPARHDRAPRRSRPGLARLVGAWRTRRRGDSPEDPTSQRRPLARPPGDVPGRGTPVQGRREPLRDHRRELRGGRRSLAVIRFEPLVQPARLELALLDPEVFASSGSSSRTSSTKRSASSRRINVSMASPSGKSGERASSTDVRPGRLRRLQQRCQHEGEAPVFEPRLTMYRVTNSS